jgi:hypothetical protein
LEVLARRKVRDFPPYRVVYPARRERMLSFERTPGK